MSFASRDTEQTYHKTIARPQAAESMTAEQQADKLIFGAPYEVRGCGQVRLESVSR